MNKNLTRRKLAGSLTTAATLAIAGCLGGNDDHDDGDHDDDHDDDHRDDELVSGLAVIDRGVDEVVADYHGHWHGELPTVELESHLSIGADIEGDDDSEISIGDDEAYQLDAQAADESVVRTESHGDHVHLHGESSGETTVRIQLTEDGHTAWEATDPLSVTVSEE